MPILAPRRKTRTVRIGNVVIGGAAPLSVQTMTKTDTRDIDGTVSQIGEVAELGCDIVRIAVPDKKAANALAEIRKQSPLPIVVDIHFDHELALMALEAGCDALRINPGNIGGEPALKAVVAAASSRQTPIRVGVNSGSLEKEILAKYGDATAEALVESALKHVGLIERLGYDQLKISVKASDALRTIAAYRLLSQKTDYPLHLGLTEAGTLVPGTASSCAALGILLAEGIGDTIRISLTDSPSQEIRAGLALLRALGLRPPGPAVVSCPTCGRTEIDVQGLAVRVETELEKFYAAHPAAPRPLVAVMGCVVNGPGEAAHADIAAAGGKGKAAIYVRGRLLKTVPEPEIVATILEQVRILRDA